MAEPPEDLPGSSENVQMASLAMEPKQFEDMVKIMGRILEVVLNPPYEPPVDERDDLADAYKAVFSTLKSAWSIATSHNEGIADALEDESYVEQARKYKSKIEAEMLELRNGILKLLKDKLEPYASTSGSKVYYLTLSGDYYKSIMKYKFDNDLAEIKGAALDAYSRAQEIAKRDLEPSDPTRLGLALSFSAFYHDTLDAKREALEMAREAYDLAMPELAHQRGEALNGRAVLMKRLEEFLKPMLAHEEELEAAQEFAKSFADMDLAR